MGDDLRRRQYAGVEGGMRVGGEGDAKTEGAGGTAGGVDAILRLQPGNDDPVDSCAHEPLVKVGRLERAAVPLLDDRLAGERPNRVVQGPARRSARQDMAGAAIVLDVK